MSDDKLDLISRRGLLRFGVLGVAGAFGVGYYSKRQRFLRDGKCIGGNRCVGCDVLADCGLPLALSEKGNSLNG